jgi:hypothetical protein
VGLAQGVKLTRYARFEFFSGGPHAALGYADPQGSARSAHRAVIELRNRRSPNRELA